MNTNWSNEELDTLSKLKNKGMKVLQFHFPDKSKSTIQTALKELENMKKRKIKRKEKSDHFRAIKITENTNTVLYGLMIVNNVKTKELAKKIGCSVRTIQGIIQGRKTTIDNMLKISVIFGVPIEVIFWQKKFE